MALIHDFILVKTDHEPPFDLFYLLMLKDEAKRDMVVHIPDDLILYIIDTMKWVCSYNPFNNEKQYGLYYHGLSLLKEDGIRTLNSIAQAWLSLFTVAPDIITLTGPYVTIEGEPDIPGEYEIITFSKNDIITRINKLVELTSKAMDSEENYMILHHGI